MISKQLIHLCEKIKSSDYDLNSSNISVGDLIDTRKTNKDFRRFVARVRKIKKDGALLIEYADGELKEYSIGDGINRFDKNTLKKYIEYMEKNMEKGSLSGPTIEKVHNKLLRWLKLCDKK